MNMHFDGGWTLPLLIIAVIAIGVFALRKRWPSFTFRLRRRSSPTAPSPSAPTPPSAPPAPHGHASKFDVMKVLKALQPVFWVAVAVFAVLMIVGGIMSLFHSIFSGNGQPHTGSVWRTPVAVTQPAESQSRGNASDDEYGYIESQDHELTLTDGVMPDWILVPEGYQVSLNAVGQNRIGMQCSLAPKSEKPAADADGPDYWCKSDTPVMRWFRPYIYEHSAQTVSFHYRFKRIGT